VPLSIKLDYSFCDLEYSARVRMDNLLNFYTQAAATSERHWTNGHLIWWIWTISATKRLQWLTRTRSRIAKREIESLFDSGRTLGIVSLYAFLERFLNLVVNHLRTGGAAIPLNPKASTFIVCRAICALPISIFGTRRTIGSQSTDCARFATASFIRTAGSLMLVCRLPQTPASHWTAVTFEQLGRL
jgi:hypothetical protein